MVQVAVVAGPLPPSSGVDAKLLHLVRKLWSAAFDNEQEQTSSSLFRPSTESIVTALRAQYREYQRKDINRLSLSVEAAIRQILSTTSVPSTSLSNDDNKLVQKLSKQESPGLSNDVSSGIRKRKGARDFLQNQVDEDDELAASAHDAQRDAFIAQGGGLNATLRDRYRRIQQDRDKQQKKLERLEIEAKNGMEDPPDSIHDATANKYDKSVVNDETPIDDCKNSKKKKKKVKDGDLSKLTPSSDLKRRRINRTSNVIGTPKAELGFGTSVPFLSPVPRPVERYSDLGGMDEVIREIRQLVEYPLARPELYQHLGVDPPRGVLLRGPPGTGKTHLANAVAGQLGVPFFRVSAPELVSGMSGESESRIRDLFQAASNSAPALIFMDELDVIAAKRGGDGRGMEKRMVAQLLTSMDQVAPPNNRNRNAVVVLAATNRPDAMDPALRRAGRFDREILLGVPDEEARERIIKTMTNSMRLCGNFDCKLLARKTPGYVGADIKSLAKEAAVFAINRIFRDVLHDHQHADHDIVPDRDLESDQTDHIKKSELLVKADSDAGADSTTHPTSIHDIVPLTREQMDPLFVTMADFLSAIPLVQPSAKREGFATVPDVSWEDIGALDSIREELKMSVLEPIRSPEKFKQLGLPLPAGVLLFGPPGCGKTLLAKAIANESGANFISVKGPELLDKYVGESERAVRLVFERARSSSPCIVFFDELDSLVPRRGSDRGGGGVSERVVNQLLTEMDGLESRRSVFVIAATNRPELIDPAMMRPGRLDKLLYVPLPTAEERVHIIRALATKIKLHDDVDLTMIARSHHADGYSGADCAALLREAGLAVLKEAISSQPVFGAENEMTLRIETRHFNIAFHAVMPSVSKKDQARYDRIRDQIARARSRGEAAADDDGSKLNEENDVSNLLSPRYREESLGNAISSRLPENQAHSPDLLPSLGNAISSRPPENQAHSPDLLPRS